MKAQDYYIHSPYLTEFPKSLRFWLCNSYCICQKQIFPTECFKQNMFPFMPFVVVVMVQEDGWTFILRVCLTDTLFWILFILLIALYLLNCLHVFPVPAHKPVGFSFYKRNQFHSVFKQILRILRVFRSFINQFSIWFRNERHVLVTLCMFKMDRVLIQIHFIYYNMIIHKLIFKQHPMILILFLNNFFCFVLSFFYDPFLL